MPFTCPQCGAVLAGDETCQDRFNVIQLKEIEQPAYYAVHHTIADVRLDTAEFYCADVRHWAESILVDSQPLVRKLGNAE